MNYGIMNYESHFCSAGFAIPPSARRDLQSRHIEY